MDDILEQLRNDHKDFDRGNLEGFFGHEPFDLFQQWYAEAFESKQLEPNAFVLSTVNTEGMPSSRIVYLKELLGNAFIFYTNYQSHKGHDLAANSHASMLFFWPGRQRQLRIEGGACDAENVVHAHGQSPRRALRTLLTRFSRKLKVAW
jgi:pyridoxine/pyridoxamine 5'-phosphate oxidase